ncbi:23S rRNA (pseudouridine(1915)-N(3))-methyltransferase RlmH [Thiohalocapsa marina]|uniref:Ribosomal RNA large subunit methyltransferase H n=1 Tax=Thiohalocapsa marina TaxID=424902 RepID=A0A5M8FU39_9GAMM|nr:23S rRNA (pseudouridine(1915)-N(3))-methyltransferase RlmH [Thiohalocapsa marina]KAA6187269.1 23S rRNA (pseudouridine(1915)-N(3))-methyltransferase RlmH [Thiohalocapsa marina]
MRIRLLSVGRRMPGWVADGYAEYARRMPPECALELVEIEPGQRGRGRLGAAELDRLRRDEGERLLKAVPNGALVVALDVRGRPWSTEQLAQQLDGWLGSGRDPALLVGGADGLAESCLARAEQRWSLSPLTFPHPLVRVILAEQLYRAWSILSGHPYHRG